MTKAAVGDWDTDPAANTDINDIPLNENQTRPSHVNNAIREIMAQVKTGIGAGAFAGVPYTQASASGPASLEFAEDTDNGTDAVTLQAPAALSANATVTLPGVTSTLATLAGTETLTNKTLTTPAITDPVITGAIQEDIYTISDGAGFEIDPSNGTIQTITLGANRTPAATNFANGESVTLKIADGTAYTITWSTVGVVWKGGTAPTLATTGYTVVELWKENNVIRGVHVGDFAS